MPESRTLIAGDALMAYGIRNRDGLLLYPPQFNSPVIYKQTIQRVRALRVETLLCAHEPVLRGAAVEAFLQDSLVAVNLLEVGVGSALEQGAKTLDQICVAVHKSNGGLPEDRPRDLAPSVAGILMHMHSASALVIDVDSCPRRFGLASPSGLEAHANS